MLLMLLETPTAEPVPEGNEQTVCFLPSEWPQLLSYRWKRDATKTSYECSIHAMETQFVKTRQI